jgi:hypothetical protein
MRAFDFLVGDFHQIVFPLAPYFSSFTGPTSKTFNGIRSSVVETRKWSPPN